jgi:acetyl-CoA carboxylase carboxyl transferase subunit alpha
MKITARDLEGMGLVDEVIPEPAGGAHVNHEAVFRAVEEVLWRQLQELAKVPRERLAEERYRKFRDMGRLGREIREVEP